MPPAPARPGRAALILRGVAIIIAPQLLPAQALPVRDSTLAARVDSLFVPWTGSDRPGCTVGVSRSGQVLVERAYGMADLESGVPMMPNTVVHSASVAKSVTAFAVLL